MPLEVTVKNARITDTMLGIEDHGIFSFSLGLDYGGSGQGAGGYALDEPVRDSNDRFIKRVGTAAGASLIMEILRVVGVSSWEKLVGQHIRARSEHNKVHAIGHLLEDKWLDFGAFFEQQTTAKVSRKAK